MREEMKLVPGDAGKDAEAWIDAVVLLARRLSAANPDAKHPGKPGNNPQGKASFPPRIFPGFLGPEALKLSVTPARQAEIVGYSQRSIIARCGSRAVTALVRVWGA